MKNRVAIVTGGSRGIGRDIALALASEGAKVVVASRTVEDTNPISSKYASVNKHEFVQIKTDVSDNDQVENLIDQTIENFGKIDILVNSAGIQGPIGSLVGNDLSEWLVTINVNLIGTALCMRAVLPHMMERGSGKIINLSGGGATKGRPNFSAYAASKAAVVRLTETVAEEVRSFKIQVNAISPGMADTNMIREILNSPAENVGTELTEIRDRLEKNNSSTRYAADLSKFLASPDSDEITGKLISAIHDDWREWPEQMDIISQTEVYTLRRLDPFTIRKLIPGWSPSWEEEGKG